MKKYITLFALSLFFKITTSQQIVLLSENFDNGMGSFYVNQPQVVGLNNGPNYWVVNNAYSGGGLYPNTPPQDSVVSGQIDSSAHSVYLHICDSAAVLSGDSNANWNPVLASDRFAYNSGFCTLGLTNVLLTFFWIGQGDSTAYGQVYYRANGGNWLLTGQTKYYNQRTWKYEVIQDSAFNNLENLQFGFRWVNQGSDTTKDISFGIDDVIAVGTYDSIHHPIKLHVSNVGDSACAGTNFTVLCSFSSPLCDGTYTPYLSDAAGSFSNLASQFSYFVSQFDTLVSFSVSLPANAAGNCYRVIIKRDNPAPFVVSDTSPCFTIYHCPVAITTMAAPVMEDADTACIKSAIDVKFASTGNLGVNNIYYAELSDTSGSFAYPVVLGQLSSSYEYPYPNYPGNISGLIPLPSTILPGCGYYIRVRSSNPYSVGSVIGPYCLKQCDITTNFSHDFNLCINYPVAADTVTLQVTDHTWSSAATYSGCNNWIVEILDFNSFQVVDSNLIAYHDSLSGNYRLIIGPLDSLRFPPGEYYLRIRSTCSSQPWNQTGTVVRLTIGAPGATAPAIISTTGDSVFCNSGAMLLYITPYNPNSIYAWSSNFFQGLHGYIPDINVILTGGPAGNYEVSVSEENYGCFGPPPIPWKFTIVTLSHDTITGPSQVCKGDTAIYHTAYLPATYYGWKAPAGVQIVLDGNNEVSMIFDTAGTFTIRDSSANICGNGVGAYQVVVHNAPQVPINDTSLCPGQTIELNAGNPGASYFWQDSSRNQTYTVSNTGSYWVRVTTHIGCTTTDSIVISSCTGVENLWENPVIWLYPNPTNGLVNLKVDNTANATLLVQITNSIGQQITSERYADENHFSTTYNLNGMESGLYYFKVITQNKVQVFGVNLIK